MRLTVPNLRSIAVVLAGAVALLASAHAATAAPTAKAPFPVTIKSKLGTAVIKQAPKRVVALSDPDADAALALGVVPVGRFRYQFADGKNGFTPWYGGLLGSRASQPLDFVGAASDYPIEAIAALKPDLILASGYGVEKAYPDLARIAPVVSYVQGSLVDSWQTTALRVGRALGREPEARKVVARVEAQIAAARKRHPEFEGKTFTSSYMYAPNTIRTITSVNDFTTKLMGQLGLVLAPGARAIDTPAGFVDISLERVDVLEADVVLVAYSTPELQRSLEGNGSFARLRGVAGRGYTALGLAPVTALRVPSVLGIPYVLNKLVYAVARGSRS